MHREMAELSVLSRFMCWRFCFATAVSLLSWSSCAVRLRSYSCNCLLKAVCGRLIARTSGVISKEKNRQPDTDTSGIIPVLPRPVSNSEKEGGGTGHMYVY
jgi:hypothetical protein